MYRWLLLGAYILFTGMHTGCAHRTSEGSEPPRWGKPKTKTTIDTKNSDYTDKEEQPDPVIENMQRRARMKAAPIEPPIDPPEPTPTPVTPSIYLSLPDTIEGEVGDWIKVSVLSTNGKTVKWFSKDKRLKVFPADQLKDTKSTVVEGREPGDYELMAYTALQDVPSDPEICLVKITGPPAPTPIPPGPGPTPPTPPAPIVAAKTLVSLDNNASRSALRGNVLGDVGYWTSVRKAGISVYLVDWNNKTETASYVPKVTAAGFKPTDSVLVFLDGASPPNVVGVEKLPVDDTVAPTAASTVAAKNAISALISKYQGAK